MTDLLYANYAGYGIYHYVEFDGHQANSLRGVDLERNHWSGQVDWILKSMKTR